MRFVMTLSFLFALTNGAAVTAQQRSDGPPAHLPTDSVPDDIVVEGYRDRSDVQVRATVPAMVSMAHNRQVYEHSEQLAKCAARSKLSDLKRLRDVVDGAFNTPTTLLAQDRLARIYIGCSEGAALLSMVTGQVTGIEKAAVFSQPGRPMADPAANATAFSASAPLGYSIYDRGAFTIQAMKRFAPDLKLTRAQTNDAAVQSRFNLREVARNRFRLPQDYRYFEVAVCMVRVEPTLATRLALSEGSAVRGDLQAALIDRARVCVGGAKNVSVDPTQFRLYIADAVYRWAVAARGVDSLIPEQAS